MDLKSLVRSIPDFPKEGILFRDITPLIANPEAFRELIAQMAAILKEKKVDVIVGPEARGFIFSAALAEAMGVGLVLARKPGKLPYKTISYEYALEYGTDTLQIHEDSILPGQRVAIVDDLLATGGTALAVAKLCEKAGGKGSSSRKQTLLQNGCRHGLSGRRTEEAVYRHQD